MVALVPLGRSAAVGPSFASARPTAHPGTAIGCALPRARSSRGDEAHFHFSLQPSAFSSLPPVSPARPVPAATASPGLTMGWLWSCRAAPCSLRCPHPPSSPVPVPWQRHIRGAASACSPCSRLASPSGAVAGQRPFRGAPVAAFSFLPVHHGHRCVSLGPARPTTKVQAGCTRD